MWALSASPRGGEMHIPPGSYDWSENGAEKAARQSQIIVSHPPSISCHNFVLKMSMMKYHFWRALVSDLFSNHEVTSIASEEKLGRYLFQRRNKRELVEEDTEPSLALEMKQM
jgi:hypothetical protein